MGIECFDLGARGSQWSTHAVPLVSTQQSVSPQAWPSAHPPRCCLCCKRAIIFLRIIFSVSRNLYAILTYYGRRIMMSLGVLLMVISLTVIALVESNHHDKGLRRGVRSHQAGNRWNAIPDFPAIAPPDIFLSRNWTEVFAQTGTCPVLHCEVGELGESVVSWIRRKDFHLLTVGLAPYSSDDRFFTAHVLGPQDWALHIKFAGVDDAGLYECQVSTHPPTSLIFNLQLVEARAEIHGAPEKLVMSGSSLKLTCKLLLSTEPPSFVFWYHEKRMINYDRERGVHVIMSRHSSELLIEKAHRTDSGNYTCAPSNAQPASITVHVLNSTQEEKPAAMQHGSKNAALREKLSLTFLLFSSISLSVVFNLR